MPVRGFAEAMSCGTTDVHLDLVGERAEQFLRLLGGYLELLFSGITETHDGGNRYVRRRGGVDGLEGVEEGDEGIRSGVYIPHIADFDENWIPERNAHYLVVSLEATH